MCLYFLVYVAASQMSEIVSIDSCTFGNSLAVLETAATDDAIY